MGQIITNEADAMAALELLCPSASPPTLSADEMESILVQSMRAVLWTASTSYPYGTIVQPTAANRTGRKYRAVKFVAGSISGTTEPIWPGPVWPSRTEQTGWWWRAVVTDGNVTWQEDGTDYDSLWDIQRAAQLGWLAKAGKAVCSAVDTQTGKNSLKLSQIYDHCVAMSNRFAPLVVA